MQEKKQRKVRLANTHAPVYFFGIMNRVFITYRREGGAETARLVRDNLQKRGYRVFLDIEDLRSGPFNTALLDEIERSSDVVVILPPGSLDRCQMEGDWVRLEIAHAIKTKRNIVPVLTKGFVWPTQPLPPDLAGLPLFQAVTPSHDYFDASIDKLSRLLKGHPSVFRRPGVLAALIATSVAVAGAIAAVMMTDRKPSAPVNAPAQVHPTPPLAPQAADSTPKMGQHPPTVAEKPPAVTEKPTESASVSTQAVVQPTPTSAPQVTNDLRKTEVAPPTTNKEPLEVTERMTDREPLEVKYTPIPEVP